MDSTFTKIIQDEEYEKMIKNLGPELKTRQVILSPGVSMVCIFKTDDTVIGRTITVNYFKQSHVNIAFKKLLNGELK